ncbi:hypothetical protein [uncultured Amnibacterium sp.]
MLIAGADGLNLNDFCVIDSQLRRRGNTGQLVRDFDYVLLELVVDDEPR